MFETYINILYDFSSNNLFLVAFLFYNPEAVPAIFKDLNADHKRMFDLLKESKLQWIALLPPHIAGIHYIKKYMKTHLL